MEADGGAGDAFTILAQKVDLDVSFYPKRVKGKTQITISPPETGLKTVRLDCRQLEPTNVRVNGEPAEFSYGNLYHHLTLSPMTGIQQYHFPKKRIDRHQSGLEEELVIELPLHRDYRAILADGSKRAPLSFSGLLASNVSLLPSPTDPYIYPFDVEIEYEIRDFRDGLYFAGTEEGDARYPHAYSRNSPYPGIASCIFPCKDDYSTRCPWEISIRCPRTLGDIAKKPSTSATNGQSHMKGTADTHMADGDEPADSVMTDAEGQLDFTEEERALEMSVICSGDLTDDIVDPLDPARKTVTFSCPVPVLAQHVGFAIGPFEPVDLSDYRDSQDDERLGSNAIRVHGFCLPGRADETANSALMLPRALDKFAEKYMSFPFKSYKVCFVDDLVDDVANSASLSICSSRLLFPDNVWDLLDNTTRVLVHALASQWIGVNIIPTSSNDWWIIIGGSYYMTDVYLRDLFGRNDYRYRQRTMADKVFELDYKRPSLFTLGELLPLDASENELMKLKAPLVLSILHNRLIKQSGKNGVDRCLWRLLLNARTGKIHNGSISTNGFFDIAERIGHQKLDSFFKQWIYGSGCPNFECDVTFNKKKLVVNMTIKQVQNDPSKDPKDEPLTSSKFMREAKEHLHGVTQESRPTAFVGPMTIRIHEADGTPYEHIVDINSNVTKVEIPYNTKYKRLKRSRRQKERAAAAQGLDTSGEVQEEVTLYMLGDVFGSAEEATEWKLAEWGKDDEEKMEGESYEWLRVDADFEWICKNKIKDMPSYMYVSQLQQDKDVVAQMDSIKYLSTKEGHPLISSFMIKTLMDTRYFHGIRVLAADVLVNSAKSDLDWIGLFHLEKAFQELFCIRGSPMTRPNDFSDRADYIIQCAILKAIAKVKDKNGKAPMRVKRFIMDTLHYNENRGNHYVDDYYVATLHSCLAQTLITTGTASKNFNSYEEEADELEFQQKVLNQLGVLQRLDEWIPSFQNIHTITALDSALLLMKNKITPYKPSELIPYVRLGNADNVRIKAWECLMELGMLRNPAVLKLFFRNIASEPSPHFRSGLLRIFGTALGQIALGELVDLDKPIEPANGLIIEQEGGASDREALLTRKRSIKGAIAGLKTDLANDIPLRNALEDALRSNTTSIVDFVELLTICALIYEPKDELLVRIKKPKYWAVEHLGNGILRFYPTSKFREAPRIPIPKAPKILLKTPKPDDQPKRSPTLILKTKTSVPSQPSPQLPQDAGSVEPNNNVQDTIIVSPKQQRAAPPPVRAPVPAASPPPPPPPTPASILQPAPKPTLKLTTKPASKLASKPPKPAPNSASQSRPERSPFPPSSLLPAPSSLPRGNSFASTAQTLAAESPPVARPVSKIPSDSRHGTPGPKSFVPSRSATPAPKPTSSSRHSTPAPVTAPPARPGPKPGTSKLQGRPKVPKGNRKSLVAILHLPPEKLAQFPSETAATSKKGSAAAATPRITQKKSTKRGRSVEEDSEDDRPLKKKASTEAVNGRGRPGPKPKTESAAPTRRSTRVVKLKVGTENMRRLTEKWNE